MALVDSLWQRIRSDAAFRSKVANAATVDATLRDFGIRADVISRVKRDIAEALDGVEELDDVTPKACYADED